MNVKVTGYVFIALGIILVIISLAADYFGLGKGGLSAFQFLGAQFGVIVSLIGAAFVIAHKNKKIQTQNYSRQFLEFIHNQHIMVCVLCGFLVTYILFFIFPAVFNERLQFQYFDRYLPDDSRLGLDIREITTVLKGWLAQGQNAAGSGYTLPYPPLSAVILSPLILLGYPGYYFLITAISIVSYFLLTLIIPGLIKAGSSVIDGKTKTINHEDTESRSFLAEKPLNLGAFVPSWLRFSRHIVPTSLREKRENLKSKKDFSLILFFFLTGMFSYSWQFELERGQYNVITFMLCILAVYLYHYHEEYRLFAYFFLSISIQLKIFPLIFIVMFIKDWKDWKNNIKRMIGLGLFNLALLFVLGYSLFIEWVKLLSGPATNPPTSIANHSIKVFVLMLTKDGFNLFQGSALTWLQQNSNLIVTLLFGYFAICFLSMVIVAYVRNKPGLNIHLLLACTIGAMLIPALSYDYKLVMLAAPMSIAFGNLSLPRGVWRKSLSLILIFFASLAYSTTLYPFKYRPDFLANSMPLLFVILTAITILYFIKDDDTEKNIQGT